MSVKDNSCGIAEFQDKLLDILKVFISVCEKNGFRYWLAGGTCLGAIRHQGFIPWDDDLDVYMPRDDYEKMWDLLKNKKIEEHYVLCRTSEKRNYHHRVIQMVDINTTFVHSPNINEDIEHGIYIDIIPLDACPNKKSGQLLQIFNAILFSVYNIQCKPEYNGGKLTKLMSFGTSVLLALKQKPAVRYKIWKKAEKRMVNYEWESCGLVKCITSQFHELMTAFPKEWFNERKVQFEDIQAVVPANAEEYCQAMYGDYMSLPPKEKQIVRHNTEYISLDEPYKKYRGIYYCKNLKGRK